MKPKSCRSPLLAGLHLPHTEPQPGPLQPHLDHGVIRTNPCVQDQIQSFQGEKIQNRLRLFRLSESFSDMENLKVTQSTNVWHLSRVENSTPPFSFFIIPTYIRAISPDWRDISCRQVENVSGSMSGVSGDWSEVAVPVPFINTFSSSWFYTFNTLTPATVYDVVGRGETGAWLELVTKSCYTATMVSALLLFSIKLPLTYQIILFINIHDKTSDINTSTISNIFLSQKVLKIINNFLSFNIPQPNYKAQKESATKEAIVAWPSKRSFFESF